MKKYYARGTKSIGKYPNGQTKNKLIYLHRFIMDFPEDRDVDHHDYDTLNNREYNLVVTSTTLNSKNRCRKNTNNKSGYRNVSWRQNRWIVQIQIDGVNTVLKKFKKDELDDAGNYAEEMRLKYYGEFAGKS